MNFVWILFARDACVMPVGEEQYLDLLQHGCNDKRTRLVPLGVHDDFLSSSKSNPNVAGCSDLLKVVCAGTVSRERGR